MGVSLFVRKCEPCLMVYNSLYSVKFTMRKRQRNSWGNWQNACASAQRQDFQSQVSVIQLFSQSEVSFTILRPRGSTACMLRFWFPVRIRTMKVWLINSLDLWNLKLEVSEKLPQRWLVATKFSRCFSQKRAGWEKLFSLKKGGQFVASWGKFWCGGNIPLQ